MSLAQEALQSREASTPLTGAASGAIPEEGALPVVETIPRTTRVTERVSQAAEDVTKAAERGERAPLKDTRSNSSADPLTLADGATRHTLYVDATAAGPRTPTHHGERWLRYAVTGLLSWSRHPAVPVGTLDMLMSYTTPSPFDTHVVVKKKSWCIGGLANISQIASNRPLISAMLELPDVALSSAST